MIPEGWHEKKIEEICLRITDGKHGDCENQVGSGYFFISAKDILENRIDYENSRQITERDFLETHKRTKFEAGDIALTNTGSIGKVVVALEGEFTSRTTFQKSVAVLKIDKKVGHANFLLNFLKLNQSHLNTIATGSSQKNLLLSQIRKISVLLPPLEEQVKIAEVLTAWDDALETLGKLIAAKLELKRGLMQALLTGKKRFQEFETREWNFVSLKDATNLIKDGTHGTHKPFPEGVPMLSAKDIHSGKVHFDSPRFITEEDHKSIQKGYQISPGDILLTIVGSIGRAAIVSELIRFSVQRSVAIIRTNSKFNTNFLYQVIIGEGFTKILQDRSNASAQAGVYLGELAKLPIPSLDLEEQIRIAEVLTTLDTELEGLRAQLERVKTQKKGLMQQLLTGKVRVRVQAPSEPLEHDPRFLDRIAQARNSLQSGQGVKLEDLE